MMLDQRPRPNRHTIPFLPTDHELYGNLATVPDQQDYGIPGEEPRPWTPEERATWEGWRDRVILYRLDNWRRVNGDPGLQREEYDRCRASKAYWITMYGWVAEPRAGTGQRVGLLPAIPMPHILDIHRWMDERMEANPNDRLVIDPETGHAQVVAGARDNHGYLSKARDMAASWSIAQDASWRWAFTDYFQGLILSYKEELVDSRSPKSVFWKIGVTLGYSVNNLPTKHPKWLMPKGFNQHENKTKRNLINPANNNSIGGESTTENSSRGDRPSTIYGDEFAFWPDADDVKVVAMSATDHFLAMSTESFQSSQAHWESWHAAQEDDDERNDGTVTVLELDWWRHPTHGWDWYDRKKMESRTNPEKFANEVERNPFTGEGKYVYEEAKEAIIGDYQWDPDGGKVWVAIDPGLNDHCAIWWLQEDDETGLVHAFDFYVNRGKPSSFYVGLMKGIPESKRGFTYDADAYEIMETTSCIDTFTCVGDPTGDARGGSGDTFYGAFRRAGINIRTSRKPGDWEHRHRHSATKNVMARLRFDESPRVRAGLKMIQNYKWPKKRGQSSTKVSAPIHDDNSHAATAMEYFAVNFDRSRRKRTGRQPDAASQQRFTRRAPGTGPYAEFEAFDREWNRIGEERRARFSRRPVA